jgi:AbrB family looped-hinge helix DNA binding protein
MRTIKLQQRGVLTLPKKIRDSLQLEEGQMLRVQEKNGSVILEAAHSVDTQLMRDLKQGMEDLKRGKFIEFAS